MHTRRARGAAVSGASAASLWTVVEGFGGDNGYYTLAWLWWLREALDRVCGGPGFTRGRPGRRPLRLGDSIDHWTVIGLQPRQRLALRFGLMAPGNGVLAFEIEPVPGGGHRLVVSAGWDPRGIWGELYWYSLVPVHGFLFRRMARVMAERALALDRAGAVVQCGQP